MRKGAKSKMSRLTKNISKILVCALLLALIFPLVNLGGGSLATNSGQVKVQDHQFIILEQDSSGKAKNVRVVDWLALKGDGTVDVKRTTGLKEPPLIQNMKGFSAPDVKDDTITWNGLKANGTVNVSNVITMNILQKEDLAESAMTEKVPLEVRYNYYLDGKKVKDLKDIAGKSGKFRLECYMKNLSKKKELVTYTDSANGERKSEVAECYLPLVITPMDWYFDNTVFSNVKAHQNVVISYIPTDYQLSFVAPLFPPATAEDDFTIWMEADVKNFSMKPLTLTCAFVFPRTNQVDPIPLFQAGLAQLYNGVLQLGAGFGLMLAGLGAPGTSTTLIDGISQINDGLELMGDPATGLPYAESAISGQFIPGVEELIAGLGSEETPDTLLYGADQIFGGLSQVKAGIGTAETANTLLGGIGLPTDSATAGRLTLLGGLNDIKAGIGNTTDSFLAGQATLLGGLNDIKTGIGNPTDSFLGGQTTLRGGLNDLAGPLPAFVTLFKPETRVDGSGIPANVYTALTYMKNYLDTANALPQTDFAEATAKLASYATARDAIELYIDSTPGLLTRLCTGSNPLTTAYLGLVFMQIGVGNPTDSFPAQKSLYAGINSIGTGVGNPTDSFLAGQKTLFGGLNDIKAGIGNATTPNTLLGGIGLPTDSALAGKLTLLGGLNDISAGLGSVTTPDTLLYGINAMYEGLSLVKGKVQTGSMENPGMYEGLQMLDTGLQTAVAGIGSASTSNTLLWGTDQMRDGLEELKAGITRAAREGTDVMKEGIGTSLKELDLTVGQLAAITERGEKFDTFLGRVENKGSTSDVRFLFQTKPVQNPNQNLGWLIALVLSLVGAAVLVVLGLFAFKRYA